jgi:transposase
MIMLGIDAHKRTHTVIAVDELGRRLAVKTTTATTPKDHLELIQWADQFGPERTWAVEDCRHLSRRLERDMLAAGERLVRVPPKMMAHSRDSARTYGKSDPIDALAVARAALREPDLPTAYLDEPARELRLLVDHREDLIAERTRHINRLRWHLHDINPAWAPKDRALTTMKHLSQTQDHLAELDTVVARIARDLVERIRTLTIDINALEAELDERTTSVAPQTRLCTL